LDSTRRITLYLETLTPVEDVACGKYNSLILIEGKLYSVGDARNGLSGVAYLSEKEQRLGTP